tara:strand:- start:58 stop:438 length:381 start_codon:yes stop_codon:yes gene_type:complete
MSKLIGITELTKKLNLINPENKKPLNYILRYWEKEFKIIKPKKINNRRFYDSKQIEIIKTIKFLLKSKGMTISGVKNLLHSNINKLDDDDFHSLKAGYYKEIFKKKSKLILEKINNLKKHGKKNSS